MYYSSSRFLCLTAAFLIPNSQALFANQGQSNSHTGTTYFCSLGSQRTTVSIHYGNASNQLPCSVSIQNNPRQRAVTLLKAQRNLSHCETKAERMQLRLLDRGWNCKENGI